MQSKVCMLNQEKRVNTMKIGRYTLSITKKGLQVKSSGIEIGLIPNTKATDFEGVTDEDFLWCE